MRRINLALRALMELGIVVAFGWWGWHAGLRGWSRGLLAIGVPLVGFGFWGLVDFRSAGRLAEPLRLGQELAVSGLAAWAWYAARPGRSRVESGFRLRRPPRAGLPPG